MAIRRCPKCGTASDDQYGFCLKCAYEFPKKENETIKCPYCGFEDNPKEANFCAKCKTPLLLNQNGETPIVIKYTTNNNPTVKNTSRLLIVLGYIFSIFGGLIGLVIAIYLSTRKDPVAKKHGHIQLGILVFYLILILVFISTGQINMNDLANYAQMNMTNLTNLK